MTARSRAAAVRTHGRPRRPPLLFVLPLAWMLSASLRQPSLPPPRTIEWLPDPVAWSNYARIFELVPLGTFIGNSLLVVALAVPLTLVTASWAGLAMALLHEPARRRLVVLAILLMMVPVAALWLTRYVIFSYLGLIDSIWALVAPALMGSSPLFVLLYYWTFRRVPSQLFEAARIDGADIAGDLGQNRHAARPADHHHGGGAGLHVLLERLRRPAALPQVREPLHAAGRPAEPAADGQDATGRC